MWCFFWERSDPGGLGPMPLDRSPIVYGGSIYTHLRPSVRPPRGPSRETLTFNFQTVTGSGPGLQL